MKIVDRFILNAYFGTLIKSFFGFLFILVIQFISRYQDQIFGKGLDAIVIFKIFAYAGVSLVVLTLPVAVLMASLMSMGSLAEHNELAALRSTGVSFLRLLRTLFFATIGVSMLSFFLSVYLLPVANLKLYSLLYDVKQLKPTFTLKEGHFYGGIEGYVIRVERKDTDRNMLYGISIFDLTRKNGDDRVVMADSGQLLFNAEAFYMKMTLYHGVGHQAMRDDPGRPVFPYSRYYFDTLMYRFDLSSFGLKRTAEDLFATHHYMMNISQLATGIDSVRMVKKKVVTDFQGNMKAFVRLDSSVRTFRLGQETPRQQGAVIFNFPEMRRLEIMNRSLDAARVVQEKSREYLASLDQETHRLYDYETEFHLKFSVPAACLLFLLIGAPLGAMLRRGGIGLAVVISVLTFLVFYVVLLQGKKMAGEGVIAPMLGAWLPFIILSPVAVMVVLQSGADSRFTDSHFWWSRFRFIGKLLHLLNPIRHLRRIGFIDRFFASLGSLAGKLLFWRNRRRRKTVEDPLNTKGSRGFDEKDW